MGANPVDDRAEADRAFARRCVHEPLAREECYRTYAPAVFQLAHRLLGNAADAEDVLQEVFIEVLAGLHTYRGEAPLRSWINRIVVRRAFRHRRRRSWVSLELVEGQRGASPEGALAARGIMRALDGLLAKIDAKMRVIFVLHEVEGYSLPEAAALAGISETAAKKRVWRARRKLEKLARDQPELRGLLGGGGDA